MNASTEVASNTEQIPERPRAEAGRAYAQLHLLIGGNRIQAIERESASVLNPATGNELARLPLATDPDLDAAVAAATDAFEVWSATSAYQRSLVLRRAASIVAERRNRIATFLTLEQGKPLGEAVAEIDKAAEIFEWFAEEARRVYGRIVPPRAAGQSLRVVREPIGVVAAFTPWNFPAVAPAEKLAAILSAGCTAIIKPAEETPATALAIVDCLLEAGVPAGAVNVVFGNPPTVAQRLLRGDSVRAITLTGSISAGRALLKLAADSIKRCVMELGGHAPAVVLADADVSAAATRLAAAKFRNAGQVCVSPTRFFVHRKIYDRFLTDFLDNVRSIKIGDGLEPGTTMGPLANSRRDQAMTTFVDDALKVGAQLVHGGRHDAGSQLAFWQPTVLAGVPQNARAMREEPFGPLALIAPVQDAEEAITLANATPYALAAYAFTRSDREANLLSQELDAGLVGINHCLIGWPETPFGGRKESGFGSECGTEGMEPFLATKLVSHKWG